MATKTRTALVTGSVGFIGYHVAARLQSEGLVMENMSKHKLTWLYIWPHRLVFANPSTTHVPVWMRI